MSEAQLQNWPSQSAPAYVGVGARDVPGEVRELMRVAARILAERGWVLRAGLAPGAEQTLYLAARSLGPVELFLPWPGFERAARDARDELATMVLERASAKAREMGKLQMPAWGRMSEGARRLHARSYHLMLGPDLASPSRFLLCWTPDGRLDGNGCNLGTAAPALRLAHERRMPVLNLAREEHRARLADRLKLAANDERAGGFQR